MNRILLLLSSAFFLELIMFPGQLLAKEDKVKITIQLAPLAEAKNATGTLILLISPKDLSATINRPDPLTLYQNEIIVEPQIELKRGEKIRMSIPKRRAKNSGATYFACAYLDHNQDLMRVFYPNNGDWYASKCQELKPNIKTDLNITLDKPGKDRSPTVPSWIREDTITSQILLKLGRIPEEARINFLVGLPPHYTQSKKRYATLYVSHGFNGSRYSYLDLFEKFFEEMKHDGQEVIIISLDSYNRYGHHVFTDSEINGPMAQVLKNEIVKYVDKKYRTLQQANHRAFFGHSSGGWTALSVLWNLPETFGHAFSSSPDGIHLKTWWASDSNNIFYQKDGQDRVVAQFGNGQKITMKQFVEQEKRAHSYGQYTSFLSVFSPKNTANPEFPFLEPLNPRTGEIDANVWRHWEKYDLYLLTKANPELARQRLSNRVHLYIGTKDEFGLYPTTKEFSELLQQLCIPHELKTFKGATHGSYFFDSPNMIQDLWRTIVISLK